ncbi:Uncharacterised protein [Escherichia coli]|nr:Uncharacterised protein [Escherichia coli]
MYNFLFCHEVENHSALWKAAVYHLKYLKLKSDILIEYSYMCNSKKHNYNKQLSIEI